MNPIESMKFAQNIATILCKRCLEWPYTVSITRDLIMQFGTDIVADIINEQVFSHNDYWTTALTIIQNKLVPSIYYTYLINGYIMDKEAYHSSGDQDIPPPSLPPIYD